MKPRHFSFVGHCRGQGEYTTLGQTLIYFSIFFTKFRRNSGKPLLSCPQVNSVNCSNECYVQGPQHVILPYFNHFSDVHGLCQFRRDSVYLFLFMTRHQQERYSGQVLSVLTFIIKNESPRHVALRHRIRIGELQLSWQNRPAGYSRLSIPPDWCLSYLQCRFGHISTISFLYISFTLVLCFLCVYYYKLKGRCTLSFVMYRYWFFFSFGYIRDEYYLQLVNVIGSGKIRKWQVDAKCSGFDFIFIYISIWVCSKTRGVTVNNP